MAQMIVGVRQLKAQLSHYVKQVKAGATIVITERGKPVGRIVPVKPSTETQLQQLVEAGLVAWSGHKLTPIAPVARTRGRPTVAELLLGDRE